MKKKALSYIAVLVVYLFIPFISYRGMAPDPTSLVVINMLIITPIVVFLAAIFGSRQGLSWFFPLEISLLFVLPILFFYNESASIYAVGYGFIAFIGQLIGYFAGRKKIRINPQD